MSITGCKLQGPTSPAFAFMISPGLSNMLNERLNCFLGRINGFEGRLEWLLSGDPFRNMLPDMLPNGLLTRPGYPMSADGDGLLADCGRRSCTGDSRKHSSSPIVDVVDSLLLPAPKRKGGS